MLDDEKEKKKKPVKNKKKVDKAEKNNEEIDKEVEEFKKIIKNQTKHARCVRKVKPNITVDWIESIIK
jgi:hypothetical protein